MSHAVRPLVATLGSVLAVAALSAPASADVLKLFGEAHGGAVGGKGLSGDAVDADEAFFPNLPHGMYGLKLGARFLIFEAAIQHHQFTNGDRLATWTQFAAGVGIEADLGTEAEKKAKTGMFVDVGVNVGFGLGTGQQVDPPLSNDEISDKGLIVEGRIGFGKHLNKLLDVGVSVPVSWGYLIKNGLDNAANDLSSHYSSLQVEGLVYLRMNLKLL